MNRWRALALVALLPTLLMGAAGCGGASSVPDAPDRVPDASGQAGDGSTDPNTATHGAVPGLALGTLPDLDRAPIERPVAPIERDEHVRAPDDLTVATLAVVDAEAAGLVDDTTDPPTLRLSQAPCRFVEAEPDASWDAAGPEDCRAFHQERFDGRGHRAVRVDAGPWQIAVTNASVGRTVGLWLRSEDPSEAPLVSSGGVEPGETLTWLVDLAPGRYLYSCPLNPTANYLLEVQ